MVWLSLVGRASRRRNPTARPCRITLRSSDLLTCLRRQIRSSQEVIPAVLMGDRPSLIDWLFDNRNRV